MYLANANIYRYNPKQGTLNITGGTVNGNGKEAVADAGTYNNTSPTYSITGGTFSSDVSKYVTSGYECYKIDDTTYKVGAERSVTKSDTEVISVQNGDETLYGIRFIFKFNCVDGYATTDTFGAYLFPSSQFDTRSNGLKTDGVQAEIKYETKELKNGTTFATDIINVPEGTTIYAVPFAGNTTYSPFYEKAQTVSTENE